MSENTRGFGFFQEFDVAQINATVTTQQTDLETFGTNVRGWMNILFIYNTDAVGYEFYLNGDAQRKIIVPAQVGSTPTTITLSGTRFSTLKIKNTDSSVNGVANALHYTTMKQYGELEKAQGLIPTG